MGVAQQVYAHLRARMLALELEPRALLSRSSLADHYGVSQTPIRDALLKLESEGLVRIYPQSRTEVAPIAVSKVHEVQFLRRALEVEVVQQLCERRDDQGFQALDRLVREQRKLIGDDQALDQFMALDQLFHATLFRQAGQFALHQLIVERSVHLDRVRRLQLPMRGKRKAIVSEHQCIVQALAAADTSAALQAIRGHLAGARRNLDALLSSHPHYFE
ncbi:MAG: hypothetical protein RL133_337 [Pseudomonadota bacterium]